MRHVYVENNNNNNNNERGIAQLRMVPNARTIQVPGFVNLAGRVLMNSVHVFVHAQTGQASFLCIVITVDNASDRSEIR